MRGARREERLKTTDDGWLYPRSIGNVTVREIVPILGLLQFGKSK